MTHCYLLSDEVNINLNVLCLLMLDWIMGHVYRANVVAINHRSFVKGAANFKQQVAYTTEFSYCICHTFYSASAVDLETVGCRFDDQDTRLEPK